MVFENNELLSEHVLYQLKFHHRDHHQLLNELAMAMNLAVHVLLQQYGFLLVEIFVYHIHEETRMMM